MPTKTKSAVMEPVLEEEQYEEPEFAVEEAEPAAEEADYASAPAALAGQELLDFYEDKAAHGLTHKNIAYMAGYYSVTKNGIERVNGAQFDAALLQAKGFQVNKTRVPGGGRGYAGLSRARVSGAGILLVSQLAVRKVGGAPGSVFEVSYPAEGQILLKDTGEVTPISRRKGSQEAPGTPLID